MRETCKHQSRRGTLCGRTATHTFRLETPTGETALMRTCDRHGNPGWWAWPDGEGGWYQVVSATEIKTDPLIALAYHDGYVRGYHAALTWPPPLRLRRAAVHRDGAKNVLRSPVKAFRLGLARGLRAGR